MVGFFQDKGELRRGVSGGSGPGPQCLGAVGAKVGSDPCPLPSTSLPCPDPSSSSTEGPRPLVIPITTSPGPSGGQPPLALPTPSPAPFPSTLPTPLPSSLPAPELVPPTLRARPAPLPPIPGPAHSAWHLCHPEPAGRTPTSQHPCPHCPRSTPAPSSPLLPAP